jgi:hypothetical protein
MTNFTRNAYPFHNVRPVESMPVPDALVMEAARRAVKRKRRGDIRHVLTAAASVAAAVVSLRIFA